MPQLLKNTNSAESIDPIDILIVPCQEGYWDVYDPKNATRYKVFVGMVRTISMLNHSFL